MQIVAVEMDGRVYHRACACGSARKRTKLIILGIIRKGDAFLLLSVCRVCQGHVVDVLPNEAAAERVAKYYPYLVADVLVQESLL